MKDNALKDFAEIMRTVLDDKTKPMEEKMSFLLSLIRAQLQDMDQEEFEDRLLKSIHKDMMAFNNRQNEVG